MWPLWKKNDFHVFHSPFIHSVGVFHSGSKMGETKLLLFSILLESVALVHTHSHTCQHTHNRTLMNRTHDIEWVLFPSTKLFNWRKKQPRFFVGVFHNSFICHSNDFNPFSTHLGTKSKPIMAAVKCSGRRLIEPPSALFGCNKRLKALSGVLI